MILTPKLKKKLFEKYEIEYNEYLKIVKINKHIPVCDFMLVKKLFSQLDINDIIVEQLGR